MTLIYISGLRPWKISTYKRFFNKFILCKYYFIVSTFYGYYGKHENIRKTGLFSRFCQTNKFPDNFHNLCPNESLR